MSKGAEHMAPAAAVGEIDVDDPTAYEANSQPWEIMATPVETRTFGHRNTYLVTPSVILYRESFDSRLRVQGLTPAGMFGFTIPLQLGRFAGEYRSLFGELPSQTLARYPIDTASPLVLQPNC